MISDGTMHENDTVSEHSFIRLEKLCDDRTFTVKQDAEVTPEKEDLLKDVNVPNFDDTLEEIDFILSLGSKLKEEGKINFPTPRHITTKNVSTSSNLLVQHDKMDLSVHMTVDAESSPVSSHLQPIRSSRRISRVISPIPTPCRINLFNQVTF
jgi:hypothetical protein